VTNVVMKLVGETCNIYNKAGVVIGRSTSTFQTRYAYIHPLVIFTTTKSVNCL